MEEDLIFFRSWSVRPSLSVEELVAFVEERGVIIDSIEVFFAHFDVLCHWHGILHYRMRPQASVPLEFQSRFADPMGCFHTRDNDLVYVMYTHETGRPCGKLETFYGITRAEFKTLADVLVQKDELVQIDFDE